MRARDILEGGAELAALVLLLVSLVVLVVLGDAALNGRPA